MPMTAVSALFDTGRFLTVAPPGAGVRIPVQLFRIESDPASFVYAEDGWAASMYTGKPCHVVKGPGQVAGRETWRFSGDTIVRPLGVLDRRYPAAVKSRDWLASIGATGPEARARCLASARALDQHAGPALGRPGSKRRSAD